MGYLKDRQVFCTKKYTKCANEYMKCLVEYGKIQLDE